MLFIIALGESIKGVTVTKGAAAVFGWRGEMAIRETAGN
jgi:hypothetical protein